jgi:membrane dipeptidase
MISARIQQLLAASIVWDNHGCLPLRAEASVVAQIERYRSAGVCVVSINVGFADASCASVLQMLSFMRDWISQRPQLYRLISRVDDVQACKSAGQLGIVFDVEGMSPVQDDPTLVQTFYELGVRWMLIAYNRNNRAGGGCLDDDTGLTVTGRTIIDEMERVGMVLCLSHCGARTAADALEYSRNPVIFSHSNPYADTPHARNIPDHLIRACARTGGVIGLSGVGPFLGGRPSLVDDWLRQVEYVVDLVGIEHVGLGLDYVFDSADLDQHISQNPMLYPSGLRRADGIRFIPPEAIAEIAEGLACRGYTDPQIRSVLGENWLRIARRVWR